MQRFIVKMIVHTTTRSSPRTDVSTARIVPQAGKEYEREKAAPPVGRA